MLPFVKRDRSTFGANGGRLFVTKHVRSVRGGFAERYLLQKLCYFREKTSKTKKFMTNLKVHIREENSTNWPPSTLSNSHFHQLFPQYTTETDSPKIFQALFALHDALVFSTYSDFTPHFHPESHKGKFLAGLWEYDVSELFLLNSENGSYQEFNLDFQGSWWTSVFDGYRAPRVKFDESEAACSVVVEQSEKNPRKNRVHLIIPYQAILVSSHCSRDSCCNLLGKCTGIKKRGHEYIFLSATPLSGSEPDFHRLEDFVGFAR